jgi:hypothetical protein
LELAAGYEVLLRYSVQIVEREREERGERGGI